MMPSKPRSSFHNRLVSLGEYLRLSTLMAVTVYLVTLTLLSSTLFLEVVLLRHITLLAIKVRYQYLFAKGLNKQWIRTDSFIKFSFSGDDLFYLDPHHSRCVVETKELSEYVAEVSCALPFSFWLYEAHSSMN